MKILLLGATGQLGSELRRTLTGLGSLIAPNRQRCDLSRPEQLRAFVRERRPDVIVNAAAYTSVEGAEREPEAAFALNALAPEVLAQEAARLGALLVHYSTDYVFDGLKSAPYAEQDAPQPLNQYGLSKWRGEQAIDASAARFLIFRTSWLFGLYGKNFVKTIISKAAQGEVVSVVADQWGLPTPAGWVARASAHVLAAYAREGSAFFPFGTYHLAAVGKASWFELATEALALARRLSVVAPSTWGGLRAVTSQALGGSVTRPAYSVLSTEKLKRTFGLAAPDWRQALGGVLEQGPWPAA